MVKFKFKFFLLVYLFNKFVINVFVNILVIFMILYVVVWYFEEINW